MWILTGLLKRGLVLTSVLFLLACQPGYTVDQAEYYARKIGVINQFDISRWHNRRILPDSTFTVVSENINGVDSAALSKMVADIFSVHFKRVNDGRGDDSQDSALMLTKSQGSDYLLYINVKKFYDPERPVSTNYILIWIWY